MLPARLVTEDRGCVLRLDTGVAEVLTAAGRRRASYSGRMLTRVARDPAAAPAPGDWVRLRSWPDGRTTIEECLTPRRPEGADAVVIPLPGRRLPA
ncbi:hypothetical protein GCM10011519_07570 [Marmoricola endophyticus]|uniref:Uncharacterized protein n=1 Tax=Marmoricola endophyticus TaxID=2040280 RepID=A0A917BBV9_9ACTN|nr:hypothetical protein [Marmoricola endophyticus]GGF36512.1 hypothetical protein GCM10011519_07570 [Marmoricola endophyticus]